MLMKTIKLLAFLFSFIFLASFGFSALTVSLSLSDSSIAESQSTTLTATISGSDTSVIATLTGDGITAGSLSTSPAAVAGVSTQAVGIVTTSTSKSWVIQGNTAGSYSLSVNVSGAESSNSGSTTLTVNTPANVVLQSSECDSDTDLADDEVFEASFVVRNTGGISATISGSPSYSGCSFSIARTGTLSSSSNSISISAGQTKTIIYDFTANAQSTESSCDIDLSLTGENNPDDFSCDGITIDAVVDSPGGGGGGGASTQDIQTKTISIDATDKTKGTTKFSNSDNEGVDSVAINFAEEISGPDLTLKLNSTPDLTDASFKVISEYTVLQYLQFTFSGESNKVKSADIKFSLLKADVTKKEDIRLARLENGVWKYYTPSDVQDLGTYYQFTANVPGFSYFAIIELKAPAVVEAGKETAGQTAETGKGTAKGTEPSSTTEPSTTSETTPETPSEGLAWWIWVIIAVVVVVIIVFIVMGLRK